MWSATSSLWSGLDLKGSSVTQTRDCEAHSYCLQLKTTYAQFFEEQLLVFSPQV